jgi:hypothetical protein
VNAVRAFLPFRYNLRQTLRDFIRVTDIKEFAIIVLFINVVPVLSKETGLIKICGL